MSADNLKKTDLSGRYCMKPFESTEIHLNGKLYFCCPSWQKTPFGDYKENSLESEWNSETAQKIRKSILDGSYSYCDENMCPFIQSGELKTYYFLESNQRKIIAAAKKDILVKQPPTDLMLNYDPSCNLSCESCRNEKISYSTDSKEFKVAQDLTQKFTQDFFSNANGKPITLNITGSGDPFASQVFREFLEKLDGNDFPNLKIDLQTNGVLFTPIMWERLHKIHKSISQIFVSIDAATKETYLLVRKGGNWERLIENVEFLKKLKLLGYFNRLQMNFVVQKRNYFEMVDFVKKFDQEKCVNINFSLIDDWGSWKKNEFNDHAIWNHKHPDHRKFLEVIADPFLINPRVFLGNLKSLRSNAIRLQYNSYSRPMKLKYILEEWYDNNFRKYGNLFVLIFKKFTKMLINRN